MFKGFLPSHAPINSLNVPEDEQCMLEKRAEMSVTRPVSHFVMLPYIVFAYVGSLHHAATAIGMFRSMYTRSVGDGVGSGEGAEVGEIVGKSVGIPLGRFVGTNVGARVGTSVGIADGGRVTSTTARLLVSSARVVLTFDATADVKFE